MLKASGSHVREQSRCHRVGEVGAGSASRVKGFRSPNRWRERRLCKTLHKFAREVGK